MLKGDESKAAYFDLVPSSNDGVRVTNEDGTLSENSTYWAGFPPRSAQGLRFEMLSAEQ